MDFNYECPFCGASMPFEVEFGYSTLHVRNPNSPSYSDPGDPGWVDGPSECPNCEGKIDEDAVMEAAEKENERRSPGEPDGGDYEDFEPR